MPCYFFVSETFVMKPRVHRFKTRKAAHAWANARPGSTFYVDKVCKSALTSASSWFAKTRRTWVSTCQMGRCKPSMGGKKRGGKKNRTGW